jgi:hypothetical protein
MSITLDLDEQALASLPLQPGERVFVEGQRGGKRSMSNWQIRY